jgi:regulator of nucleoside diphosphate kinase
MKAAQYVLERPQLVIHYDLTPVRRDRGSRIAAASSIPKRVNRMRSTEPPNQHSALLRRKLLLTETDLARLIPIVRSAKHFLKGRSYVELIDQALSDAGVVLPGAMPQDVVTVNSTVVVTDLDLQQQTVYTVVFPQDARNSDHLISLITPLGAALLGSSVGDIVEVPTGWLRIDRVVSRAA